MELNALNLNSFREIIGDTALSCDGLAHANWGWKLTDEVFSLQYENVITKRFNQNYLAWK